MLVFFTNFGRVEFLVAYLALFRLSSAIDRNVYLTPVNAGVPRGSILDPTFFLSINDLPVDVICNIAIYADYITLYSKSDQAYDL